MTLWLEGMTSNDILSRETGCDQVLYSYSTALSRHGSHVLLLKHFPTTHGKARTGLDGRTDEALEVAHPCSNHTQCPLGGDGG